MPLKLIWYILILICLFTFVGLNLGNQSDVNVWFGEEGHLKDVPIVISFFIMYILGAISVIPYLIGSGLRQRQKMKKKSETMADTTVAVSKKPPKEKGRRGLKRKVETEETKPEII
ncbi:MAG: hypothetical protein PQJ50_03020 [Spirochaetales bacterium]|nr:hypothetical protein [Spirochaetales bacterium]